MSANIFKCTELKKQIGDFLLNGIDFSVKAGYVVGVIGRNGAGKTTLINLILGSFIPADGEILLNGISVKGDVKSYKKKLAYVLNETPFPVSLSPWECGFVYGSYYDGFDYGRYKSLLNKYGIPVRKKIKTFSKGQKIRHQLAFALSYNAVLYVFDEPAAGLDVEFRDEFYKTIRDITAHGDKTVIYASHLVDELEHIADYILWISGGKQKYFGTVDSLMESYQLVELSKSELREAADLEIVGESESEMHKEALVKAGKSDLAENVEMYSRFASLKEIMYYEEKAK